MENRYTSFNLLPHVRKSLVEFPSVFTQKSKSARKKSLQKKTRKREEARDAESAKADISHSTEHRFLPILEIFSSDCVFFLRKIKIDSNQYKVNFLRAKSEICFLRMYKFAL